MKVQVTFETGHPARIEGIDGAVAVVWEDQRPLRGLAARADWRLNGFLSRLVQGDRFSGKAGEWLLVHTQGKLPFTHLFLVGLGRGDDHGKERARAALEGIAGKLALAGLHAFAIDLDEVVGGEVDAETALVTFLDALSDSYPEDEFADPPYLPALQARGRNDERVASHRRRRQELLEARRRWEEERRAEEAARVRAAAEESDEADTSEGVQAVGPDRPVAGHVPEEAAPPPDPAELGDPELEPYPERTVRVVMVGEADRVRALREGLRTMSQADDAPIDVDWQK
ncbi:MAG: hypothetical protein KDA24_10955 [Deltaproteobacteria bacterium]|nr:hypothetical protein [Deltaproteobacteria bacterium]